MQRYVHEDILLELIDSYLGPNAYQNSSFIRSMYFIWQQKRGRRGNGREPKSSYDIMRTETLKLIDEDPNIYFIS